MFRLFLLILSTALFGASCSTYEQAISASSETKQKSYQKHYQEWNQAPIPKEFGRHRSAQIVRDLRLEGNRFKAMGGAAMATLITKDGYALTAHHVVKTRAGSMFDTVLLTDDDNRLPVHLAWLTMSIHNKDGQLIDQSKNLTLMSEKGAYLFKRPPLTTGTLRIVRAWPKHDLALVKLPVRNSQAFALREHPLQKGELVFASGNASTPYAGTSAGRVVRSFGDETLQVIHTSAPIAKGDSGGPVFDQHGTLIGVVSRVYPASWLVPFRLSHSSLRMADPKLLRRLIAEDRSICP